MENSLEKRIEDVAKRIQIVVNNYDQIEDFTVDYIIKDINASCKKTLDYLIEITKEMQNTTTDSFLDNFDRENNSYVMSDKDLEVYDQYTETNTLINSVKKIHSEITNDLERNR